MSGAQHHDRIAGKRITIVSGLQLCDNPRVVKEATTLAKAGYRVTVLSSHYSFDGAKRNHELQKALTWRAIRQVDASSNRFLDRCDWNCRRLRRKVMGIFHNVFGYESISLVGYCANSMLRYCRRNPADLYIAHADAGVWVGSQLIQLGCPVAVDMEDWHTEDLRIEDRRKYPTKIMAAAESVCLKQAVYCSTTSLSLSIGLEERYGCRSPVVLYNAFSCSERKEAPRVAETVSHHSEFARVGWVSQVIGPDRGLEQLVAASHHLKRPIEIHLTGRLRPGMEEALKSGLHAASRIVFQDQVPHQELLALMQTYDIGFAGELAHNKSRDLTVTNKILHYFLAGIPAVCSDTQGQLEICSQVPEATRVYSQRDPVSLAAAIDSFLGSPDVLQKAKLAAWEAGSTRFCWEAQEPKLLHAVMNAIGPPHGSP